LKVNSFISILFLSLGAIIPQVSIAAPSANSVNIGVLYWSMSIPGQVAMRKGLEAEMQRINAKAQKNNLPKIKLIPMVAGDGSAGVERQIVQMLEMVKQAPSVIIVQPTDNAALAAPLRAANAAGIPVVAYDQYISGGNLAAYITSDNQQAGYLDGEYIAAQFDDQYEIKLILVEYPRVSSTVERLNGFLDALRDHGQAYKILKIYEAVEPVAGKLAGKQLLQDFPGKGSVDVLFSVNDGGGLSVVDALFKAGRSEIMVATVDGDPKSIDNIRQSHLTRIDAAQFCGPLGAEALKSAYAIATGQVPAKQSLVPVFPVTRETLSRYTGWSGPIPDKFTKPWSDTHPIWDGAVKVIN
jgi:ribose transport system substrate-binding protein